MGMFDQWSQKEATPSTTVDPKQADFTYIEEGLGLPEGVLYSLMMAESDGNPYAVSPMGALGPFQLLPSTAAKHGANPYDAHQAALAAGSELQWQLGEHEGDLDKALASYNYGHGNFERRGFDLQKTEDFQKKHSRDGRSETTEHRNRFYRTYIPSRQQAVKPDNIPPAFNFPPDPKQIAHKPERAFRSSLLK